MKYLQIHFLMQPFSLPEAHISALTALVLGVANGQL